MLEKILLLETIDRKWMDHLYAMDLLKEGIHLRGYAGQDPKIRYKVEGFEMFQEMWDSLEMEVAQLVMKLSPVQEQEEIEPTSKVEIGKEIHQEFNGYADDAAALGKNVGEVISTTIVNTGPQIGGNDPCPCGSGKKYKKCCGR